MRFIPPALQDEDGHPGPKVLAFELEGRDGQVPVATILVERQDYHGTEWVIWSARLTDGQCFHGHYYHTKDGATLEKVREHYDEHVQHYRS